MTPADPTDDRIRQKLSANYLDGGRVTDIRLGTLPSVRAATNASRMPRSRPEQVLFLLHVVRYSTTCYRWRQRVSQSSQWHICKVKLRAKWPIVVFIGKVGLSGRNFWAGNSVPSVVQRWKPMNFLKGEFRPVDEDRWDIVAEVYIIFCLFQIPIGMWSEKTRPGWGSCHCHYTVWMYTDFMQGLFLGENRIYTLCLITSTRYTPGQVA